MTFQLSAEERARLLDTCLVGDSSDLGGMEERDWNRLEEAFFKILADRARAIDQDWPTRGNADYLRFADRPIGTPRQAGVHPFVELAQKNIREMRNR